MNTHDLDAPVLPELSDERVAAIERDVFARIADDRRRQRRRRTLGWSLGSAAAAVLVVAAVIAPGLTASLSGGDGSYSVAPATDSGGSVAPESAAADRATVGEAAVGESARAVISTASATVVVDDVATAAQRIADDAQSRGGYVESLSVDAATEGITGGAPVDGLRFDTDQVLIEPAPAPGSGAGRVTVRIPDEDLDAAIAALAEVGEVTSSTVSRQDVTDQAIDLRARVAAGEASVARLTELLAQAADVADLIAAETALAERQAALESDRQQLAWLEGQVDLSTLTVQLVPRSTPVEADPAGFTDGVMAGWNGLVAAANGVVIAIGFLLPWLAVAAGAGAVVWGIVRLVRRARRARGGRRSPGDAPPAP